MSSKAIVHEPAPDEWPAGARYDAWGAGGSRGIFYLLLTKKPVVNFVRADGGPIRSLKSL